MKLYSEWRFILRKAWSIRLCIVSAILSGVEIIVPLFSDSLPRNLFAALSFVTVVAAAIARLVVQKDIK